MDLLKELNQDRGVMVALVTHNEALARWADRVLQLRDGKLFEKVVKVPSFSDSLNYVAHYIP